MMAGLRDVNLLCGPKMEATSKIVPIAASYPGSALLSVLILRAGDLSTGGWHAFIVIGIWFVKIRKAGLSEY
jgi:hypothetical protein